MDKLAMCRICLVENVRMFEVSNKNLQDIYETLTNIPFMTEDRRPNLACYFCYSKLKECCGFKRKCLEAEEHLSEMLNSCEQKPFESHRTEPVGLVTMPVETICIEDYGLPKSNNTIEVEVPIVPATPSVSQTQYEFIAVKIEPQSDELEPAVSYTVPENVSPHSKSDSEDDVPLLRIKTAVQNIEKMQPQVSRNIQSGGGILDGPPETKKSKFEEKITAEQKDTEKEGSNTIQTTSTNSTKPVYRLEELFTKSKHTKYRTNKNIPEFNASNKDLLAYKISQNIATSSDKHEAVNETPLKPFKCDICHRSYILKSHLIEHNRKHTGEKPFECHICHKSYAISGSLKTHIRTHTDTKPFQCGICQRNFTSKPNLKMHARIHTGEKPFKCHKCQQAFKQKIHLQRHMSRHTGEKPFECAICRRSFSLKHGLIRHFESHEKYVKVKSDRKRFECALCQQRFTAKYSLKRHLQLHEKYAIVKSD